MNFDYAASVSSGKHSVVMNDCHSASITGVNDVDSFDERRVRLYTECGELTVWGEDLHVGQMSIESGNVTVEGEISALIYGDRSVKKKLSFLGRILR